jgi:ATP-dependent metalloprotease FtsH
MPKERVAQLRGELLPEELRHILTLQTLQRHQLKAEKVASELRDVVKGSDNTKVDSDRLGFWLDLLSDNQLETLWKASDGETRAVILDSLLEETKEELMLDPAEPMAEVQDASALLSKIHAGRLTLSQLQSRWKKRYNPVALSTEPKNFTLQFGGKKSKLFGKPEVVPNARFNPYDVRRIKATGPLLNDLIIQQWDLPSRSATGGAKKMDGGSETKYEKGSGDRRTRDQQIEQFNMRHVYQDERFQFIHPEVVFDTKAFMKSTRWRKMPKMPYMEFYHGLRQRNWTSPFYETDAEPWKIDIYLDGGQSWPRTTFGVRAVVTTQDGKQRWVSMQDPGAEIATQDRLSQGGPGGIYNRERLPVEKSLEDYGYLQVFEQLQQAYEPLIPKENRSELLKNEGKLAPNSYKYDDPAQRMMNVSYYITPPKDNSLSWIMQWKWVAFGAVIFAIFLKRFFYNLTMKAKAKERRAGAFEDMNEAIDFGRSRADTRAEGKTGVSLGEVAGINYLRDELEEMIDLLKNPYKYQKLRVRPPKGILLMGPPGVGKTLIAKAIAGEAGVPFYSLAGSEFTELIVGVGAARVRDLFKRARVNVPCLIFIDEIEALGHKREMNESENRNEERDQALNQLLTEMDGFTPDTGIVVMAATNAPTLIDEALLRPGRFDRKIQVRKPNPEARKAILEVHAQKHPIEGGVDLTQLANDTPGLSGAELEKVLNEAALEAIRRHEETINKNAVYYALDRVLEGSALPSLPSQYDCNKVFAYHESGVALVSELLRKENENLQTVKSVSLIPRNRSWSRTTYFISSDKSYKMLTQEDMKQQIQIQLAGRAAEEIAFGEPTSYSALDVARASDVAVKMLNSGLTEQGVLPFTFPADFFTKGIVFSDPQVMVERQELLDITSNMSTNDPHGLCPPSDITRFKAEATVRSLLKEAHARNLEILRANRKTLDAISEQLFDNTELSRDALVDIMTTSGASLPSSFTTPAHHTESLSSKE